MKKIILKDKDMNFDSYSKLIKEKNDYCFVINSKLVSLENVIFFSIKILPTILLNTTNKIIVHPRFNKLGKYSNDARAIIILLNEEQFRNTIIEEYEKGTFK